MKIIAGSAIALALMLGVAPTFGSEKDPTSTLPNYNVKTELNFSGTIAKVRDLPAGNALAGIYVTIQARAETLEVYLGPADFVKLMKLNVRPGLRDVGVTGSKVRYEGNDLVLARELRFENLVFSLRDEKGVPNWLWATLGAIPTGF